MRKANTVQQKGQVIPALSPVQR